MKVAAGPKKAKKEASGIDLGLRKCIDFIYVEIMQLIEKESIGLVRFKRNKERSFNAQYSCMNPFMHIHMLGKKSGCRINVNTTIHFDICSGHCR